MSKTILMVAAHPDDEVLGCGATLARHVDEGDVVHILIMAEGVTSRDEVRKHLERKNDLEKLRNTATSVAQLLGAQAPEFAGLPDNRLDSLELLDIIKVIEKTITRIKPSIVYTHHNGDLNIDHSIVNKAVMTACRPKPNCKISEIYTFETVSSTEWSSYEISQFIPNHFVAVDQYIDKKIEALKLYESEILAFPHARSIENIEALSKVRGASVGVKAAEAFSVIRQVVK